jgi:CRISPR/Cas system-associated endonuclease Cas3-HD
MIIYHDVGKIFYQNASEELSFPGHEFISAYIFWKVFDKELNDMDILYMFPIIFHHHSMGIKKRLEELERRELSKPNDELLQELREILAEYIEYSYAEKTINVIENLKSLPQEKIKERISKIEDKISTIWRNFHGAFARNALKLLLIMILCDYEGSKDRGKSKWIFGEVLEEFFLILQTKTKRE